MLIQTKISYCLSGLVLFLAMLYGSATVAASDKLAAATGENAAVPDKKVRKELQQLERFYKQVKTLKARFVQRVSSTNASKQEESAGVFYLQRPGKFRWDYTMPFEQRIIADGKRIWVYDVDMDQVIVKELDLVLGNTPAVLLSGTHELKQQFQVRPLENLQGRTDALSWVLLIPKNKESNYRQIVLGFNQDDLKVMELIDNFEQKTQMDFMEVTRNPKLDASLFVFSPPPGVDVIGSKEILGQ